MAVKGKKRKAIYIDSPEFLGITTYTAESRPDMPGMNWTLSEETEKAIEEIDANIRAAKLMSGALLVG